MQVKGVQYIPHNQPTLGKEEEEAVRKVIQTGWVAQGIQVRTFENEFCRFLGLSPGHAVAVSSGTAALFLALSLVNGNDLRVAFPGYVCSALRNATLMAGGQEILIDSSPETPNMNLNQLRNSGANAVIIPHMFGIPLPVQHTKKDIFVIEDGAQALGAKINNQYVGLQGDIGVFSFYATKLITSGGQGGMIVSKNKRMIEKIKDFRHFDEIRDKKMRFNFQMTDIQAAIGRVQLKKISSFLRRREEIFQRYKQAGITLLEPPFDASIRPVRFRAIMVTNQQKKVLKSLWSHQINGVIPFSKKEVEVQNGDLTEAKKWTDYLVSLPIYPTLSNQQVDQIISIVLKEI